MRRHVLSPLTWQQNVFLTAILLFAYAAEICRIFRSGIPVWTFRQRKYWYEIHLHKEVPVRYDMYRPISGTGIQRTWACYNVILIHIVDLVQRAIRLVREAVLCNAPHRMEQMFFFLTFVLRATRITHGDICHIWVQRIFRVRSDHRHLLPSVG
jgi:hypothetical protein